MSTSMNPLHRRGINKLPLELLTEIFKLASTHRFLDEGRTVPPAYALIALSHVCGMWRAAIRGAPQLWTIVCGVEPPALVREIVALSQKMPLAILCAEESHYKLGDEDRADEVHDAGEDGGDESDDASNVWEDADDGRDHGGSGATSRDAAETLLEHLHRTFEIQISLDHNDMPDLLPLFDIDAPLLESLALRVVGGDAPVVVNPFKGTAPPRLTSLSLHGGCELSQTSALWANLTRLHLHRSYCHREPHPTNSTFIERAHPDVFADRPRSALCHPARHLGLHHVYHPRHPNPSLQSFLTPARTSLPHGDICASSMSLSFPSSSPS
ncbi:hypothetical protein EYR38_003098 [Pleurotus pulmonarius]|nr:hypothetical protein EYR38_003098 [Pleurotus pulmonarius]